MFEDSITEFKRQRKLSIDLWNEYQYAANGGREAKEVDSHFLARENNKNEKDELKGEKKNGNF